MHYRHRAEAVTIFFGMKPKPTWCFGFLNFASRESAGHETSWITHHFVHSSNHLPSYLYPDKSRSDHLIPLFIHPTLACNFEVLISSSSVTLTRFISTRFMRHKISTPPLPSNLSGHETCRKLPPLYISRFFSRSRSHPSRSVFDFSIP